MEFQELRVLVAIIETGGFHRAGKALNLSQSAVSQSLANLERKMGVQLISRTSPLKATPIGSELLVRARKILAHESEFSQDLERMKRGYLQRLTVGVDDFASETMMAPLFENLRRDYSEASFTVKRLPAREMVDLVMDQQLDLALGPYQKNMEGLKKYRLRTQEIVLVSGRKNPELKYYNKDPLYFLSQTTLMTSHLDDAQKRPSKKKIRDFFRSVWEIDNISLQVSLVAKGLGVTFLPVPVLNSNPKAKGFVVLDKLPFCKITKPYGIYFNQDKKLSSLEQAFIQSAKRQVAFV